MELADFLAYLNSGKYIEGGSKVHQFMHKVSQEAIRICADINCGYHTPEELRRLMSELTESQIDEGLGCSQRSLRTAERTCISERTCS